MPAGKLRCPLCKKGIIVDYEVHIDNRDWFKVMGYEINLKTQCCTNENCSAYYSRNISMK